MSLLDRVGADLIAAMKARDIPARDALRMLKTALKATAHLDDATALRIVRRQIKTREENAVQFEEAGRTDLAAKERAEILVLEQYVDHVRHSEERQVLVSSYDDLDDLD